MSLFKVPVIPVLLVLVLTVLWDVTGILSVVITPVVLATVEGPDEGHRGGGDDPYFKNNFYYLIQNLAVHE